MVGGLVGRGALVIDQGEIGVPEQGTYRARAAGPDRADERQAHAATAPLDDPGRSPVPWKVRSASEEHGPTVDLAIVHDVAGRDEGPGRSGVEARRS